MCWTEVAWSPRRGRWDILRPMGPEYWCNIPQSEVVHRDQWGLIDGAEDDSAPAPSEGSTKPTTMEDEVGDHPDMEEVQQLRPINEIHINTLAAHVDKTSLSMTSYVQNNHKDLLLYSHSGVSVLTLVYQTFYLLNLLDLASLHYSILTAVYLVSPRQKTSLLDPLQLWPLKHAHTQKKKTDLLMR
ncbi:hypothetical protein BJY52DRAFT_1227908 [Lactarius psammicola]|nr:hypothetical protein BJY52DRAFT_1227908 [Lactarius psammicola]